MSRKDGKCKGFGKNIGRHVFGGYPGGGKRTNLNMVTNEMMSNVYMFRAGGNRRRIRKRTSSLIVTKNRKRTRKRKLQKSKKSM